MKKARIIPALSWLFGFYFLGVAVMGVIGAPHIVHTFDAIGWGNGFRYLTAFLQAAAGVLLLFPRVRFHGAILAALILIGATVTRIVVLASSPALPILLGLLAGHIAWKNSRPTITH